MTDAESASRAQNLDQAVDLDPVPVDTGLVADESDEAGPGDHEGGVWGGKASDPDDGIPSFDDEDSEEVEATLGDDSYDEAEAEPESEGPQ